MLNTPITLGLLAILCGASIAIQAATNSTLLKHNGEVIWVAITLFSLGLLYLITLAVIKQPSLPGLHQLISAPWWSYIGGFVVATYVVAITYFVPRLGVGTAIFLIVCGQVIAAVVIDHFGLFGLEVKEITASRLVGCVLLVLGVLMARS